MKYSGRGWPVTIAYRPDPILGEDWRVSMRDFDGTLKAQLYVKTEEEARRLKEEWER